MAGLGKKQSLTQGSNSTAGIATSVFRYRCTPPMTGGGSGLLLRVIGELAPDAVHIR